MVAVFRALSLGLLLLAILLHVVGFVTHYWSTIHIDVHKIAGTMNMGNGGPAIPKGLYFDIEMGLWDMCMKTRFTKEMFLDQMHTMSTPKIPNSGQQGSLSALGQSASYGESGSPLSQNMGLAGAGAVLSTMSDMHISVCMEFSSKNQPGWMKTVKAFCILSLVVAVLPLILIIYSCIGNSKGDRNRYLPYIIGGTCFTAGVALAIGITVYGSEYKEFSENWDPTMIMMVSMVMRILKDNMCLGYGFVLQAVSTVFYVLSSLVLIVSSLKGWEVSVNFGGSFSVV